MEASKPQTAGPRDKKIEYPIEPPPQRADEADEDYFDRLASLYDESKRGKQDPNIEYAFDHVMERNLKRTHFQNLGELSANGYRIQIYK